MNNISDLILLYTDNLDSQVRSFNTDLSFPPIQEKFKLESRL